MLWNSQLILLIFFCFSKQRCQEKCFNHPRLSNSMWIVHTDRRKHLISINWKRSASSCQLCKQTWPGEYRGLQSHPLYVFIDGPKLLNHLFPIDMLPNYHLNNFQASKQVNKWSPMWFIRTTRLIDIPVYKRHLVGLYQWHLWSC